MPMISLLPESVLSEMKAYYGEEAYHAMTSEEQMILAYVWNGDSICNTELQQLLGLNSIEVGKILHQMVTKQLLNKENKNRWTTYTLLKDGNTNSTSEEKSEEKNEEKNEEKTYDKKSDKKNMLSLTNIENKILTLIKQNSTITYEALGQALALGETSVYQAIRHLKELNIISREGGRKNGNWVINVELNRVQI